MLVEFTFVLNSSYCNTLRKLGCLAGFATHIILISLCWFAFCRKLMCMLIWVKYQSLCCWFFVLPLRICQATLQLFLEIRCWMHRDERHPMIKAFIYVYRISCIIHCNKLIISPFHCCSETLLFWRTTQISKTSGFLMPRIAWVLFNTAVYNILVRSVVKLSRPVCFQSRKMAVGRRFNKRKTLSELNSSGLVTVSEMFKCSVKFLVT